MSDTHIPQMILDALRQHLPAGAGAAPYALLGLLAFVGALLLFRGARYAGALAATAFAAVGVGAGAVASFQLGVPLWPALVGGFLLGIVAGGLLIRFWMAALVAGCFAVGGVGVYTQQSLLGPIDAFHASADTGGVITLPQAEVRQEVAGAAGSYAADLWNHLSATVPNFQTSIASIVGATLLAGFFFGLMLPKAARALGAATVGTVLFAAGAYLLTLMLAPQLLGGVSSGTLGIAMAVIWAGSMLHGLRDQCARKADDAASPAPAKA